MNDFSTMKERDWVVVPGHGSQPAPGRLTLVGPDHPDVPPPTWRNERDVRALWKATMQEGLAGLDSWANESPNCATATAELFRFPVEEHALVARLLALSPDAIVVSDLEGRVLLTNEKATQYYSCEQASEIAALGLNVFDFIVPEDRPRAMMNAQHTLRDGFVKDVEYRAVSPDGRWLPIRVSAALLRCEQGQPVGFVGVVRDLTRRQSEQHELQLMEQQVRHVQRMAGMGLLTGEVAHDFNNLLVGVMGNADLALTKLSSTSPVRSHVHAIKKAATCLAELTEQMLAYTARRPVASAAVDLSQLAGEMSDLLRAMISKKVAVRYQLEAPLPTISAPTGQMRQVVMNLVVNAAEACGNQGGVVSVRTRTTWLTRQQLRELLVGEEMEEGPYVCLDVADTGCGIDDETRGRLFEPFFSTKDAGRGLGLAVVLDVVRAHRGGVDLTSHVGQGTSFSLLFPCSARDPERPVTTDTGGRSWDCCGTVLVVDDEDLVRTVVHAMLRELGWASDGARNGREALAILSQEITKYDIVLLDHAMPDLDGPETFYAIRQLRPDLPVVVSSGYGQEVVMAQFVGSKPGGFLAKPYDSESLANAFCSVLTKHSVPASPSAPSPVAPFG